MGKSVRLYNIILPVWLLWIFPQVWLVVLPGNLAVDTLVLFLALTALRCPNRGAAMKRLWWRVWLRGFAADAVSVGWLLLALTLYEAGGRDAFWLPLLGPVMYDPFAHPVAFFWTVAAVVLSGLCIYHFDRRAMAQTGLLTDGEVRRIALALAVVTAPWTFLIPVY